MSENTLLLTFALIGLLALWPLFRAVGLFVFGNRLARQAERDTEIFERGTEVEWPFARFPSDLRSELAAMEAEVAPLRFKRFISYVNETQRNAGTNNYNHVLLSDDGRTAFCVSFWQLKLRDRIALSLVNRGGERRVPRRFFRGVLVQTVYPDESRLLTASMPAMFAGVEYPETFRVEMRADQTPPVELVERHAARRAELEAREPLAAVPMTAPADFFRWEKLARRELAGMLRRTLTTACRAHEGAQSLEKPGSEK